jgi:hypothetical protein
MRHLNKLLIFLIIIIHQAYANEDGRWQLAISGQDQLEYGTQMLAGGLNIGWIIILEFSIKEGLFTQGSATARLLPGMSAFSRPPEMFECAQISGTFASRSGTSFSTPHLRYQAFPLSGKVTGDRVQLNPYLEYPGNYYAILYQCSTKNEMGDFWLERAPRVSRELGKRQNAHAKTEEGVFSVKIKELKSIPPGSKLEIPLIDGFKMSMEQETGARLVEYHLRRIAEE